MFPGRRDGAEIVLQDPVGLVLVGGNGGSRRLFGGIGFIGAPARAAYEAGENEEEREDTGTVFQGILLFEDSVTFPRAVRSLR